LASLSQILNTPLAGTRYSATKDRLSLGVGSPRCASLQFGDYVVP